MRTLLTITERDIEPDAPIRDTSLFTEREAARAVLLDEKGAVYLLNVSKRGFHKLPGGGIEAGESPIKALERELIEEVGCRAEVIAEIGVITEYRWHEDHGIYQTSYGYLGRKVGEQREATLEAGELADGMYQIKARSIDEAIALLEGDHPLDAGGRYIQKRDLAFLKAVRKIPF